MEPFGRIVDLFLFLLFGGTLLHAQQDLAPILLDACRDTLAWKTFQSAGVDVSQHRDSGRAGSALRFDISFTKGTGYGGVVHVFDTPLPENFEFSFWMHASVPVNNFEVKISNDSLGEDIWWVNSKNFHYPAQWKKIVVKKRHFGFAWGPHPLPTPDKLRRIELVVTAGTGGSGSVWIDDLELIPLPLPPKMIPDPTFAASSSLGRGHSSSNLFPSIHRAWESKTPGEEWIEEDFKYRREIGGVQLRWDTALAGISYDILGSIDGSTYDTLRSVHDGKGGSVLVFTPEAELRYLKLSLHGNRSHRPYRLQEVAAVPSESLSTANQFIELLAAESPRGLYPRYFLHEGSYWTVVGVPSDTREALFCEDGTFEVDRQCFSIEPVVKMEKDAGLLTWAGADCEQTLADGYIPIPSVLRRYPGSTLNITLLASGEAEHSSLLARYVLKNTSGQRERGALFLTIRPFQVNPTYQWLNFDGGFARTDSIAFDGCRAVVGGKTVTVSGSPSARGASSIDEGEIVERIMSGKFPSAAKIVDPAGVASGAFEYRFDLTAGDSLEVIAAVPFVPSADHWAGSAPTSSEFRRTYDDVRGSWERTLNSVRFSLPPEAKRYVDILRSNLAYILINKDGPGFQPGSRSYERSWIRDGSMTSASLLKLGINGEVRRFIDWYSSYQYGNGMVPCVVDQRGADPVPENDSHGELIFACAEYFRFTRDTSFLRSHWHNIVSAAEYIQHLRSLCSTPEFLGGSDEKRACFGLVTESISHEGYSAKPMHSYWDDFFSLKGLKDAAYAARILGEYSAAEKYDSLVRAFRHDVNSSIIRAMRNKKIDYIPGCVELGDFDATSTSIALFPCGEIAGLPSPALTRTFDKYYEWSETREKTGSDWEGFTPYEVRNVGSFVYLWEKGRAHHLLEWFLQFQRPRAWNQWAEVVWRDERRAQFIGDMPHTWVGSDFINAFRAMFVYEGDDDRSLIVGAGLKENWVKEGFSVEKLPTHFGTISYSVTPTGLASHGDGPSTVTVQLYGTLDAQRTHLYIPASLLSKSLRSATVDGIPMTPGGKFIVVSHLPATIVLRY